MSPHVCEVEKKHGAFIATCLETGLVAADLDRDVAITKLIKLCKRQRAFAESVTP